MLSSDNRLKKDKDFKRLFLVSKPFVAGHLVFRNRKNNFSKVRFGFVISNKIDKRSTRRNSLKRRLRSIARAIISEIKPGYDIVVIVRENYSYPYQSQEISRDFNRGLRGLGLIDEKGDNKNNRDISKNSLS
jgi:ribonuclease P protein component